MNGVWSQFAEEEMFNNIPYKDRPTRHLKAVLKEMQINGASKSMTDLMLMRQIENILLERQR